MNRKQLQKTKTANGNRLDGDYKVLQYISVFVRKVVGVKHVT